MVYFINKMVNFIKTHAIRKTEPEIAIRSMVHILYRVKTLVRRDTQAG